jgi:hypothetical protein
MTWQPIETAPKAKDPKNDPWVEVLVCWEGRPESACFLVWKHNRRISADIERGLYNPDKLVPEYWGDPDEMDDYDLAKLGAGPTHWLRLPTIPGVN